MSKLDYLTIAVVIVGIVALSILGYKIYQNNSTPIDNTNRVTTAVDNSDDDDYTYDDSTIDSNVEEDDNFYDEDGKGFEENVPVDDQYTNPIVEDTRPQETVSINDDNTDFNESQSYNSSGRYMVISGSFRFKANAESHVRNLKKKGYDNASWHIFNKGAYAVVLVDRFESMSEAKQLKNRLASDNIEAIIQTQK